MGILAIVVSKIKTALIKKYKTTEVMFAILLDLIIFVFLNAI